MIKVMLDMTHDDDALGINVSTGLSANSASIVPFPTPLARAVVLRWSKRRAAGGPLPGESTWAAKSRTATTLRITLRLRSVRESLKYDNESYGNWQS